MQTTSLLNNGSNAGSVDSGASVTGNTAAQTKDMFTKLLVAQIKNQDPLSPTDPAQFVNQLTQLSQTESLQNLSSLTTANANALQSMQVLTLGAQVGSNIMAQTDTVQIDESGTQVPAQVTLENVSSGTRVILTGKDGVAHKIDLGSTPAGLVPFNIDPAALGLSAGSYTLSVETSTKPTGAQPVDIGGRLNSVRVSGSGGIVLSVSNIGDVATTAITAFNGKSSASATQSL
jgi:flagellar basal-body rod modification protein FlgD